MGMKNERLVDFNAPLGNTLQSGGQLMLTDFFIIPRGYGTYFQFHYTCDSSTVLFMNTEKVQDQEKWCKKSSEVVMFNKFPNIKYLLFPFI